MLKIKHTTRRQEKKYLLLSYVSAFDCCQIGDPHCSSYNIAIMNSPSISTTTIPQEIVDNIIDELFYIHGKKSLSKMAIASRSCLHRARSHLFNTLVLASRSACPLANLRELNMLRCLLRGISVYQTLPPGSCIPSLVPFSRLRYIPVFGRL